VKLIRRLLLSDKNPATYGELGGALRHPKMQAILICMGAPALLSYFLWSRFFDPYYAAAAGIVGSFAGLAFLMWEVSGAISEKKGDQSGGSSNG
jgi:hypothetical protein